MIHDNLIMFAFFILKIDSVLSNRVANENDASRRLKSEFLVQFDGVTSNQNDLVILIGEGMPLNFRLTYIFLLSHV